MESLGFPPITTYRRPVLDLRLLSLASVGQPHVRSSEVLGETQGVVLPRGRQHVLPVGFLGVSRETPTRC